MMHPNLLRANRFGTTEIHLSSRISKSIAEDGDLLIRYTEVDVASA